MVEDIYNSNFYKNQMHGSLLSANRIVPFVMDYINPKTVVDIGCGVGTWLSVFQKMGVEILGLDGNYVDHSLLKIKLDSFMSANLEKSIFLNRTFDMAISLEVAEHLTANRAKSFITELTQLSNVIMFSAAIPGQGGTEHINEQWLSYWVELFGQHDYVLIDCIRPNFWMNSDIDFWYRQNIVLFCKKDCLNQYPKLLKWYSGKNEFCDIVHPEQFKNKMRELDCFPKINLTCRFQDIIYKLLMNQNLCNAVLKIMLGLEIKLQPTQCLNIFIFGTGEGGRKVFDVLNNCKDYNVKGFFDNDVRKQNSTLFNNLIYAPRKEYINKEDYIIVSSLSYSDSIKKQLVDMGVNVNKILLPHALLQLLLKR